jgi:SAM-dependent methyltransferase
MICPICFSVDTEQLNFGFPFFSHWNHSTVKSAGVITRCCLCRSLSQIVSDHDVKKINDQFSNNLYGESNQTSQTLIVDDFDRPVTRSFLQAELLGKLFKRKKISILDIGCFDGRLLSELSHRFKDADLHGFDVINVREQQNSLHPQVNFRFWQEDLGKIEGDFDLICLSHSLMYVKDIHFLMEQIKRLGKSDSFLFIQTPDISKNPCYILMGDQYFYFTPQVMKNILQYFGFHFSTITNDWFPREIVGIAQSTSESQDQYTEDLQVYHCVENLGKMKAILGEIPGTDIGVLGTTSNAAFVDGVLGAKVSRFFDEMEGREGSKFRNKEVFHPKSLQSDDLLVIPYGESGFRIKKRFENQYQGRFIVV